MKMSFLNISNPVKWEQLVKEFLQRKRNIQLNNLSERIGDIEMKREMSKMFSPITESQQKSAESTQKAISEIPKQLALEQQKQLALDSPQTFSLATKGSTIGDTALGLYSSSGKLFIGNKETIIDADGDYIIGDTKCKGTPGLIELLTLKDTKNYAEDDRNTYKEILITTGALWTKNDPNTKRVKPGTGDKYYNIIKPIREEIIEQKRSIENIMPNPDELVKRFNLLLATKESGSTGVNDDMINIVGQLYNLKQIDNKEYQIMIAQAQNLYIKNAFRYQKKEK